MFSELLFSYLFFCNPNTQIRMGSLFRYVVKYIFMAYKWLEFLYLCDAAL